jgi:hypothetical protein
MDSLQITRNALSSRVIKKIGTHVSTGEVTALKHEAGNDTVEAGVLVAETLLSSAESTEVLSSLGYIIIEEIHDDTTAVS